MKRLYLKVRRTFCDLVDIKNKIVMEENSFEVFHYDDKNFNIKVSNNSEDSKFDIALKEKWSKVEQDNILRYSVKSQKSKVLEGKYRFYAQLNSERATMRRKPEEITSMQKPFDPDGFNFKKISQKEIFFDIGKGDGNDILAVNVSPILWSHSLLLPERLQGLPQQVTLYSLQKALEILLLSNSKNMRVLFNSLCANASVNHLHWHFYYLDSRMILEWIPVKHFMDFLYILEDFPAKGYCIKYSSFEKQDGSIHKFILSAFEIVSCLQKNEIAHNIYITRSKTDLCKDDFDDIRIFIWARAPSHGVKNTEDFIIAACEVFGHLPIRTEKAYLELNEEYVSKCLEETTSKEFLDSQKIIELFLKEKNSSK